MARAFIAFAPNDLSRAVALADALQRYDIHVSWADQLQPSRTDSASEVIAQARQTALVVALWSEESIDSERAQAVARDALDRGSLLSVVIDDVAPPLPIARVFQCVRWDGNTADFGFSQLVYEISLLMRSGKPGPLQAGASAA